MAAAATVQQVSAAPSPTAVIAQATSWEAFPALWPRLLDEVWTFVRAAGLPAERNVMLYRDDVPHVEVGVELAGAWSPGGRVVASTLPGGEVVRTVLRGSPTADGLAAAHDALARWCDGHGRRPAGPRWEVYGHWREPFDAVENEIYWLLA